MGGGVVENAKLSKSLLKNTNLSEQTIDNLDTEINFAISAMQDSMAKFQAGDWDGGMAVVDSINVSDINALKFAVAQAQQAAGEGKLGKGLGGLGKAIEVLELIDKWKKFVEKQDAAFNDTGPASRYAAAQDNYIQAVKDYQSALAALAQATGDCPSPDDPPEPEDCPPEDIDCLPPPPPEPPEPPTPPGPPCTGCTVGPKPSVPRRPTDPNEIVGPDGAGADRWRTSLDDLPYLVLFENLPAAQASAVIVDITLPVDDDADLESVIFTGMGWGGAGGPSIADDSGVDAIDTVIDVDGPAEVHVLAEVDAEERELHWRFEARDEVSGELFVDGFLPPNDPAVHDGEGWVDFRLSGADGLVTGDTLTGQATIVFDTEAAIDTNVWVNRLDTTAPTASVDSLPATVDTATFPVSWTGADDGSGVATYDVYVSADGGPFELWLDDTAATSGDYAGADGVTYAFEAVATDAVGLEEPTAGVAEATTTVDVVVIPGECETPFDDVPPTHLFCDDILWLYDEGITVGTTLPGGSVVFRPLAGLTRQEMAAFLYRYADEPEVTLTAPFFADVPASHPFYDEIQWMGQSGNSVGSPNPAGGKPLYEPGEGLSRQEMAAFLWRLAGEPVVEPGTPAYFADVPASHVFYDAIQWMGDTEISVGTPNPSGKPSYGPRAIVTRQAMAAFLHRADPVLD
jgi:hypothetical protein